MAELGHEAAGARRDLSRQIVRGAGWMIGTSSFIQAIQFVASIVVARLLGPRSVGLAGMALIFSSLAIAMVDSGFGAAIIHRRELSEEDASSAFWASLVIGVGLTLAAVGLSWPLAALFGEPRVQGLFAVLALAFLFTSPGIVPEAILMREMRFRALQVRVMISHLVSVAATIAAAVAGAGPWALVVQMLVLTSTSTILCWRTSQWRPQLVVNRRSLREIMGFGSHVLGAQVTDWAAQNADNLLVGRFLGATSLGVYSLAFNIAILPVKRIAQPLAQVFFPAFARMSGADEVAASWLRAVTMIAAFVVPTMLAVTALAPDFVALVFGPRWHAAGYVLQVLALVGLLQAVTRLNAAVLQGLGRTGLLFRYTAASSGMTVAAFAVGLIWGLHGVAIAYLAVSAVLQPASIVLTSRALGVPARAWLAAVARVVEASVGMFVATVIVRAALAGHTSVLPRFGLALAEGLAVYATLLLWRAPAVLDELATVARRLRRRVPVEAAEARAANPTAARR